MTLEQRIQRLEDIEAIKQLKAQYLHGCDRKQLNVIKNCFAEGAILIDYGAIGCFHDRDAFVKIYEQMACNDHIIDMHHGQNPQINWVSENSATAIWDLYFFQINTQENTQTQLAGYYQDEYIKQNSQWKICSTKFNISSTNLVQMDQSTIKPIFSGSRPPA